MADKKSNAGRKPVGDRKRVNAPFRIDPKLLSRLREMSELSGASMGEINDKALDYFFDKSGE